MQRIFKIKAVFFCRETICTLESTVSFLVKLNKEVMIEILDVPKKTERYRILAWSQRLDVDAYLRRIVSC